MSDRKIAEARAALIEHLERLYPAGFPSIEFDDRHIPMALAITVVTAPGTSFGSLMKKIADSNAS